MVGDEELGLRRGARGLVLRGEQGVAEAAVPPVEDLTEQGLVIRVGGAVEGPPGPSPRPRAGSRRGDHGGSVRGPTEWDSGGRERPGSFQEMLGWDAERSMKVFRERLFQRLMAKHAISARRP